MADDLTNRHLIVDLMAGVIKAAVEAVLGIRGVRILGKASVLHPIVER